MVQLTEKQKYEIIVRNELGQSSRQISDKMKINRKSALKWIKKYKNEESIKREKGSGRKRKTNKEDDKVIFGEMVNDDPNITTNEIQINLKDKNINLSTATIKKRLKENDFIYGEVIEKPLLTINHKQLRLKWAIEYYNTDWTTIKFSDETMIRKQFKNKQWMHKDNKTIVRVVKYPMQFLVWGSFHYGGVGDICIFKGIMDADRYINILEDHLLPTNTNEYSFQFDNDPKHKSTKALSFLFEKNIKCISWWPPNSPDLNPIENLWKCIKDKLKKEKISTTEEFKNKIEDIWINIPYKIIYNLINSMPNRIDQVIKNNGDYINY